VLFQTPCGKGRKKSGGSEGETFPREKKVPRGPTAKPAQPSSAESFGPLARRGKTFLLARRGRGAEIQEKKITPTRKIRPTRKKKGGPIFEKAQEKSAHESGGKSLNTNA